MLHCYAIKYLERHLSALECDRFMAKVIENEILKHKKHGVFFQYKIEWISNLQVTSLELCKLRVTKDKLATS